MQQRDANPFEIMLFNWCFPAKFLCFMHCFWPCHYCLNLPTNKWSYLVGPWFDQHVFHLDIFFSIQVLVHVIWRSVQDKCHFSARKRYIWMKQRSFVYIVKVKRLKIKLNNKATQGKLCFLKRTQKYIIFAVTICYKNLFSGL